MHKFGISMRYRLRIGIRVRKVLNKSRRYIIQISAREIVINNSAVEWARRVNLSKPSNLQSTGNKGIQSHKSDIVVENIYSGHFCVTIHHILCVNRCRKFSEIMRTAHIILCTKKLAQIIWAEYNHSLKYFPLARSMSDLIFLVYPLIKASFDSIVHQLLR